MAPLDWDSVLAAKPASLNEEDADNFFEMLKNAEPDTEVDLTKLLQLFKVTQAVMVNRHNMFEETMAEAEEEAKKARKKEQEMKNDKEKLQKELIELKRFGPDSGGGGGSSTARDSRYLRDMVRELEDTTEQLKQEIKDLQRDLNSEKRAAEKYSERISVLEKELQESRVENDQLRQDNSDYKMQLQAQRENIMSHQGDDMGYREKLARKNHELAEAMEELQNLTDANEMLQQRCDILQKNLEDATRQMDHTTEDYMKLKVILQQSDAVTDRLREENEILKNQVQDLTEQVHSKTEEDDVIMVAVNNKIEEWQELVNQKDQKIADMQDQLFRMREQFIAATMDSDKASITALTQALKEKDKQIEELTTQANNYVREMEMNAALIEDLRDELMQGGTAGGDRLQNKIQQLQKELFAVKDHLKNSEEDVKKADADARAKDKELSEALERMQQYEKGEYGLQEAVMEIKDKKTQISVRDRQIEELTQYINKAELKINEILDENEELRFKLGMDPKEPLDLTQFRTNKAVRHEEEKALNFILQRQIEELEEERVSDKQKIRKLGQQLGKRAVDLGLTVEDMMAVQGYADTLRLKSTTEIESQSAARIIKQEVQKQESQMQDRELYKDYSTNLVELNQVRRELAEFQSRCTQLEEDNKNLESSLKEVMEALQQKGTFPSDGQPMPQFPSVDRMLAALEAKRVIGYYDSSLQFKEQVDFLRGRNEEIRTELRQSRVELSKMQLERDKAFEELKRIQKEAGISEGSSTQGLQVISLPEGMTATSAEVIASLNEHLVITLQELSQREQSLHKVEKSLENYKRKFALMRHQQGLLYQEYLQDKKEWVEKTEKLAKELKELQGTREEDLVRISEFDRLVDTLKQDDVEVRRRLSEMTRRITVLRVNEKALVRRYHTLEEIENTTSKANNHLHNEMNQMEAAISERIGYLQRYKDMAAFKITAVLKALEDSVPQADFDKVNKEYHQLTEKYRDLLEKGNTLVSKTEAVTGLENEVKRLTLENEELKSTMRVEKERFHSLEAALEELHRRGVTAGIETHLTDADFISISKKLTMLEMKELNERQRAEHAVRISEQQQQLLADLHSRNKELEDKFAELTTLNLQQQKVENELQDQLSNAVTKAVSDADRKKILELEETEIIMKQEISKLKDVSDVALAQVSTLEMQQLSHEKENKSLRQQLLDFQAQSDEKNIIGKLHRAIVQLQISESMAVKQLASSKKRQAQLDTAVLRLEQKVDSKEQSLFHARQEFHSKMRYLKRSLQEVRLRFAGAVPLSKQEKFAKNMIQLQQDKAKLEMELKEVLKQRHEAEDSVAELTLQRESLQELLATLKDSRGAAKVVEWHSKMDAVRLEELRQRRNNAKLNQQIKYLEGIIQSHEVSLAELEADNVRLLKEFEEHQMRWEQREVELERHILTMEKQGAEIADAAARFEQATGSLPDSKLPVANQLEQAISTIRNNVKVIVDIRNENNSLKSKVNDLERLVKDSERTLIERERLISALRLRMPATTDRDVIIKQTAHSVSEAASKITEQEFGMGQSMKMAQSTIHSLQQRIQQKEETIMKYQELLNQARQDMIDMNRRHEQELKTMQQKLHAASDIAFSKFKEAAQDMINKYAAARHQSLSDKPLTEVEETMEELAEKENIIAMLNQKLKQKEEEVFRLRAQMTTFERHVNAEKQKHRGEQTTRQSEQDKELHDLRRTNADMRKEIIVLKQEVAALQESNAHGPSASMKNLVERLKNQLSLKEKQHQALSKALTDLRADMVAHAQSSVIAHADEAHRERSIQQLIDAHTKDISEQLEDTKTQLEQTKRELKKCKESESILQIKLEDVKEELSQKDHSNSKLRSSKAKLETEVGELEKKLERLNTQKKTFDFERMQELEELRRRNSYLEGELKRKHMAEKPYEQKELERVQQSEESRKWQRTLEKMKLKLKEKDEEIEKLSSAVKHLKATLDRISMEKDALENKRKVILGSASRSFDDSRQQPDHYILNPKDERNFVDIKEYQKLFARNQELQNEILKLSQENMELHFQAEAASKNLPRMEERMSDLQKYIEALKQENLQLSGEPAISPASSIKRLGESGKNTKELEKTIALLKKVVERVQRENEKLKKSPGVVSTEQVEFLRKENEGLKMQLNDLQSHMGASLSERYTSQQKGNAKLRTDYEQIRKELAKERETNEKLRFQIRNLEMQVKQDGDQLMTSDQQNRIEERLKGLEADREKNVTSDIFMKAQKYDEMAKENIESALEVKALKLDNHKLRIEVDTLKKELKSFGPNFFEEIEDLKYNYKQAVQRCTLLEDKLQKFGVPID